MNRGYKLLPILTISVILTLLLSACGGTASDISTAPEADTEPVSAEVVEESQAPEIAPEAAAEEPADESAEEPAPAEEAETEPAAEEQGSAAEQPASADTEQKSSSTDTKTGETPASGSTEQPAEAAGDLASAGLKLTSLFSASMESPDTGAQVDDCAVIELYNDSGRFIASADITVVLNTGYELKFKVTDFPAGETLWAFDLNNTVISNKPSYASASAVVTYEDAAPLKADSVKVTVSGTTVTLTNISKAELSGLKACFHTNMGGTLVGGAVITYDVPTLPAGGSTTLDIMECYLGEAELVRITE